MSMGGLVEWVAPPKKIQGEEVEEGLIYTLESSHVE